MRRFVFVLFACLFLAEGDDMFSGMWQTPFHILADVLWQSGPLKLPLMDILFIVGLVVARGRPGSRTNRAKPMDKALWTSVLTVLVFWIYGVFVRGGQMGPSYHQLSPWILGLMFAFLLISVLQKPKDFETIGKIIVGTALYRSFICVYFYMTHIRNQHLAHFPEFMTTHGDTVLFVTAINVLAVYCLETRSKKAIRLTAIAVPFILLAIQLNNRRLAWVSLLASLGVVYAMFPANKVKAKVNRVLLVVTPILALYVAAGWGRPERIFRPVRSLSTLGGEHEDASTKARNSENAGLLVTLQGGPIMGTGWGQEYIEVDSTYSIAHVFPQFKYMPHNGVLGLVAFSGMIGFIGTWMVFPVSAYLNARSYRASKVPLERAIALVGLAEVVICTNQTYGDMGFISFSTVFIMATGIAGASRISVLCGAWPSKASARARAEAAARLRAMQAETQATAPPPAS